MTIINMRGAWPFAAMSLLLSSCVPSTGGGEIPPPPPPPDGVAKVTDVSGSGALIHRAGGSTLRAGNGAVLYSGDRFTTDDQSTMTLAVLEGTGGTIKVSSGTDPLLTKASCFAISLFHRGTLEVWGHHICVHTDGGVVLMQDSDVIYSIDEKTGIMRVTVREGQVSVIGQPGVHATTGQTFEVRGREIVRPPTNPRTIVPRSGTPVVN